jgi:hypothetical protein
VNDEKERIWKVVVLSQHLLRGTEQNHKIVTRDSLSVDQDLNPGPSECDAGMLTTRLQHLVYFVLSQVIASK